MQKDRLESTVSPPRTVWPCRAQPAEASRRRMAGLTLVELMIGLTLGLLVTVGLLGVYLNATRTNTELAKANAQVENGRYAIQFLREDIAVAGFWGSYVPKFDNLTYVSSVAPPQVDTHDVPTAVPDPCLSFGSWPSDATLLSAYTTGLIGIGIQAYDAIPSGTTCTSTLINDRQANTDILVVRHADACEAGVGTCPSVDGTSTYFQASRLGQDSAGTVCAAGAYPSYLFGTTTGALNLQARTWNGSTYVCARAPIRRFVSNIYYVRNFSVTAGDGIPTLVRISHQGSGLTKQPLIDGIEGFRVELGLDTQPRAVPGKSTAINYGAKLEWAVTDVYKNPLNRGDGQVDGEYIRCSPSCTAAQLVNVVAVRVFVLARTRTTTPGYTDGKTYQMSSTDTSVAVTPGGSFQRHVFTATVRLDSVAGRRETPP